MKSTYLVVAQGDGKFGSKADPRIPSNKKKGRLLICVKTSLLLYSATKTRDYDVCLLKLSFSGTAGKENCLINMNRHVELINIRNQLVKLFNQVQYAFQMFLST